jgi:hypothetical protein
MSPRSEKSRTVDLVDNKVSGSVSQTDTAENQSRLFDKVKITTARNGSFISSSVFCPTSHEKVVQNTDDEIQAVPSTSDCRSPVACTVAKACRVQVTGAPLRCARWWSRSGDGRDA